MGRGDQEEVLVHNDCAYGYVVKTLRIKLDYARYPWLGPVLDILGLRRFYSRGRVSQYPLQMHIFRLQVWYCSCLFRNRKLMIVQIDPAFVGY